MTWPASLVATGDLISATQLNQLPIALAEASGASASYTFSSIPTMWTHLLIVWQGGTASGNTGDDLLLRFNGDTNPNYNSERLRGEATTTSASSLGNQTSGRCGSIEGGSDVRSSGIIVIPQYGVAQRHTWLALSQIQSTINRVEIIGGLYVPAVAAITSILLLPAAGNFLAGSIATLYGMGAI
jgi:hypothetical protein